MPAKRQLDQALLRKLYVDDRLGYKRIGEVTGASGSTVLRHLVEMGIPIRSYREGQAAWRSKPGAQERIDAGNAKKEKHRPFDRAEVIRLYTGEEQRSAKYIGDLYGCSHTSVLRVLARWGVPLRSQSEQERIEYRRPGYREKYKESWRLLREVYVGPKSKLWKGGKKKTVDGYYVVYAPWHPNACRKYVREHRLVMEQHIGRFLGDDEVVHHKNGDRLDNRIENLEILTNEEHARLHGIGRSTR